MWDWVALAGIIVGGGAGLLWWMSHRERQAAERASAPLVATIVELTKENHVLRDALDRSEKARMAAHEAGGPERVLSDLDKLRQIGDS